MCDKLPVLPDERPPNVTKEPPNERLSTNETNVETSQIISLVGLFSLVGTTSGGPW